MTPKDKLDKALGISDGETVDDFLANLDIVSEHKTQIANIDTAIKDSIQHIDVALSDPKIFEDQSIAQSVQKSLNDINDLVLLSKQIIQHLYTDIVSSELIDSELITSTATFIQATHDNVKEYIELYRDRLKFFDNLKLEMVRHKNKTEAIKLKHQLDLEKIQKQNPLNVVPENMRQFSSEDIVNVLKKIDLT